MSNRNATASWSGYSHQGKVGILVALKKINELNLEINGDYILDYEQQEDVRLLFNGREIEVHQVKALGSGNYISSYTSALDNFEPCAGRNFLHTIRDVRNWGYLKAEQNKHGIERYDYGDGQLYCDLDEIQERITNEIQLILQSTENDNAENQAFHIQVYNWLLGEIDHRVRQAHNDGSFHPRISLDEILGLITDNPTDHRSRLFNYRQALYKGFEEYICDLDNTGQEIEEDHLGVIRSKIREIYCLSDDDFEQFLRNVHPHTTGKKNVSSSNIDEFFNNAGFSSVFLFVLQNVIDSELKISPKLVPNYFKEKYYLVTAIIDAETRKASHAMRIAENESIDFLEFETDFLITENYSGKINELARKDIRSNPEKFYSPKDLAFISKNEALNKLNN